MTKRRHIKRMATEELGLHHSKPNSFSIDSILKMDNKELIKIPNLTSVLDGKNMSPMEICSVTNANEMQGEKALDLSVNIPNVVDENFRKSFKNHAQINNINGLYTNNVLSDHEHLAKAKNKQYISGDGEQIETFQNMLKREMDEDERKLRYLLEEKDRRAGSLQYDIDEIQEDYDNTSDSDTANFTSVTNVDTESVELSADEETGVTSVENDEFGDKMTVVEDSTAVDRSLEKAVNLQIEGKKSGLFYGFFLLTDLQNKYLCF